LVEYKDIQAAAAHIYPYVRRTPLIQATDLKDHKFPGLLSLKLENLQVSGSFKARGAINKLLSLPPEMLEKGLITASGGNHGLAVAYAGWIAHKPATIFLPHGASAAKAEKMRHWGAQVIFEGSVFDEANAAALDMAERDGKAYLHPFADPAVIAGQGTIALEILKDLPDVETLIVSMGGGGLISGISVAAKKRKPSLRIIGVEPVGAPKITKSLEAGHLIQLPEIKTSVAVLAPKTSADLNLEIIRQYVDETVLVSDEEMREAAFWLWFEMGIAAELAGAAAMATLMFDRVQVGKEEPVCVLVCGSGTDGIPAM
jgi:threonine dehydratase